MKSDTEGLYLIHRAKIKVQDKRLHIVYCIRYDKRHELRGEHEKLIHECLVKNHFGTPSFDNSSWREHMRNNGIRGIRIEELL